MSAPVGYTPGRGGSGGAAVDLSNVDATTGRAALGLGSAAIHQASDFATKIPASGDTTGVTDTAAIQAALLLGPVHCPDPLYIVSPSGTPSAQHGATLVLPDGTNGTISNGGLTVGEGTVFQMAAGANPTGPMITTANVAYSTLGISGSFFPVKVRGLKIDMNVQNQAYGSNPAWATHSYSNYLNLDPLPEWGPDGMSLANTGARINDVEVINPIRHGFVVMDQSANGGVKGGAFDLKWRNCGVYGYYSINRVGATPLQGSCTTTATSPPASTDNVITSTMTATPKVGMIPVGPGVVPNTFVMAVSGTSGNWTITLNQKCTVSGTATLVFGYGARAFWNASNNGQATSDSYLESFMSYGLFGDWQVKNDNAGGWTTEKPHCYSSAYSGGQFLSAIFHTMSPGAGFDNVGNYSAGNLGHRCVMGQVNQLLTAGTTYTSLTVNALPVNLPRFSQLMIPGAGPNGGPAYVTVFTASATPGATTVKIYPFTPDTTVTNPQLVWPMTNLFMQGADSGSFHAGTSANKEQPNNDFVYLWFASLQVPAAYTVTSCMVSGATVTLGVSATTQLYAGQVIDVEGLAGFTANAPTGSQTITAVDNTALTVTYTAATAPTGTWSSGGTVAPTITNNLTLGGHSPSNKTGARSGATSTGVVFSGSGCTWYVRGAGNISVKGTVISPFYSQNVTFADGQQPNTVVGAVATLDTAASNIKPVGPTGALGTQALAAPSDHVHAVGPPDHVLLQDLVGATSDPAGASAGITLASGTFYEAAFVAHKTTMTQLIWQVATAGVIGTGSGGAQLYVWDPSNSNIYSSTTGVDAALTASGKQAVAAAVSGLTIGGIYKIGLWIPTGWAQSTYPNLKCIGGQTQLVNANKLRMGTATSQPSGSPPAVPSLTGAVTPCFLVA